jgi:hypothetical protein
MEKQPAHVPGHDACRIRFFGAARIAAVIPAAKLVP